MFRCMASEENLTKPGKIKDKYWRKHQIDDHLRYFQAWQLTQGLSSAYWPGSSHKISVDSCCILNWWTSVNENRFTHTGGDFVSTATQF
jgi:hypothetical protein